MLIQGSKCSGEACTGSIFKAAVAREIFKDIIDDKMKVYDYSCGFGTRLLGLMSLQKNVKYIGVEPNTETYNSLLKLIKDFNFNADIYNIGSEDFTSKEKVDIAFSSPPYFNLEVYSNESTQAYNKYSDYEIFLEKYWRQTIKNIKKSLRKNSLFICNVGNSANEFTQRILNDYTRIIEEEGFKLIHTNYMITYKSHLSSKKRTRKLSKGEPIFYYEM